MEIKKITDWGLGIDNHLIIGGPCSAENEEQVLKTCQNIATEKHVNVLRAGIWKPRTRPGSFEGVGKPGLDWLVKAKELTGLPITTEVATPEHVEACLEKGVDILWIGARTTVNPFSVQAIADALKGTDIPILIKNPINPDVSLWMGAVERIYNAGINRLGVIHRGFSAFGNTPFRNDPKWELAIEFRRKMPSVDMICDPSHIAGNRELIPYISQKALDLDMHGLMIESHISPSVALSDAKQQVTPVDLNALLGNLTFRSPSSKSVQFENKLDELRKQIDELDDDLLHHLSSRMKIAEEIGTYKKDNNVTILQVNRWEEIVSKRVNMGNALGLSEEFIKSLLQIIHKESIRKQQEIMNNNLVK